MTARNWACSAWQCPVEGTQTCESCLWAGGCNAFPWTKEGTRRGKNLRTWADLGERLQRRTDSSLRETQDEEVLSLKGLGWGAELGKDNDLRGKDSNGHRGAWAPRQQCHRCPYGLRLYVKHTTQWLSVLRVRTSGEGSAGHKAPAAKLDGPSPIPGTQAAGRT